METRFKKYKKELLNIIYQILPDCKVYLFGSRARGTNDQGADIDLALDNKKAIKLEDLFKIKEKIEESTIPLFVDLVDINSANEAILKEIKLEGILWKN